ENDRGVRLAVDGAARVNDVLEPFDLDRAVDRKLGPRAAGKLPQKLDVHLHGTVTRGRVDPDHAPVDDAVARIHVHELADLHVARLRLRDLQLGLQIVGPRDPRDVRAERDALSLLDLHFLEHACDAGAHLQGVDALEAALARVLHLVEARRPRGALRRQRRPGLLEALPLDVHANLLLTCEELGALVFDRRHHALIDQLLVRLRLEPRALVLRLCDGELRALIELLAFQAQLHLRELGLRSLELVARLLGLAQQVGIRQLDEHRIRLDCRAWPHQDALDPAIGLRGDPADLPRRGHTGAAHLPQHLTALHVAEPERCPVDARRCRLEPADADRERREEHDTDAGEERLADPLLPLSVRSRDVHARRNATSVPASMPDIND